MSVARSDISQFKDSKEPNLNDVVDYLASSDPNLVIKAASYLQHLSYGDDSMKAKIRFGFVVSKIFGVECYFFPISFLCCQFLFLQTHFYCIDCLSIGERGGGEKRDALLGKGREGRRGMHYWGRGGEERDMLLGKGRGGEGYGIGEGGRMLHFIQNVSCEKMMFNEFVYYMITKLFY